METPAVSGLKLKIKAISMLKLGLILFFLNKMYIAHCVDESVVLAFVLFSSMCPMLSSSYLQALLVLFALTMLLTPSQELHTYNSSVLSILHPIKLSPSQLLHSHPISWQCYVVNHVVNHKPCNSSLPCVGRWLIAVLWQWWLSSGWSLYFPSSHAATAIIIIIIIIFLSQQFAVVVV